MTMTDNDGTSEQRNSVDDGRSHHHHRGRSSEGRLDKEAILAALAIEPGQTILDAGCGNGYMSKAFSEKVGERGKVYALDPDEISISNLHRETEGTNIVTTVGDITTTTELPAGAFDLIYVSNVVHGFSSEQMQGFAAEARRLLSPGGRLAIVEIAKRPTPFGPPMHIRFTPDELRDALSMQPVSLTDVGEHYYMQVFQL